MLAQDAGAVETARASKDERIEGTRVLGVVRHVKSLSYFDPYAPTPSSA